MIKILPSTKADTRSCDFSKVSKLELFQASLQHIADVAQALAFFQAVLTAKAALHDYDKLSSLDWFHQDFITGFRSTCWWDNHRKIHRHHLDKPDGCPADVNLVDVLEHIADCVVAGMARTGHVYPLHLPDEILRRAFENTVALLKANVVVQPK